MRCPRESIQEQDDMAAASEACLRRSPLLLECQIHCEFVNGILTLRGFVPNYSSKHVAQSLAKRIDGVQRVSNRLEVMPVPVGAGVGDDGSWPSAS